MTVRATAAPTAIKTNTASKPAMPGTALSAEVVIVVTSGINGAT